MAGVNKVILVGRLGSDPEVRSTSGGHNVCTLSLATSDTWVKDGKREEKTEWHKVIFWDKLADLAQKYLKKGSQIYIEGKLQTRSWNDQQGQKRYTTEILGNSLQFLGANTRDNQSSGMPSDFPGHMGHDDFGGYDSPSRQTSQSMDSFQNIRPTDEDIPF